MSEINLAATPETEQQYNAVVSEIKLIKDNIDTCISDMTLIVNNIKNSWISSASEELVTNMNNSFNDFKSYADELSRISKYLEDTMSDFKQTEEYLVKKGNEMLPN